MVGFDDIPEAAFFVPPLTTVRQDFEEVGRRCVARLLDRIDPPASGGDPVTAVVVRPEVIVRASSAAPRAPVARGAPADRSRRTRVSPAVVRPGTRALHLRVSRS